MTKTDKALRVELEDLKNQLFELTTSVRRQSKRTDRVVQVLLNTLPEKQLNQPINFVGEDCHGNTRFWPYGNGVATLRDFLKIVIDP